MSSNNKQAVRSDASDAALLLASTVVVNAGNYAINLILGRWLGPADFSEAGVLATLVLMLSFIAIATQLGTAKYVAMYQVNQLSTRDAFIYWFRRNVVKISFGISILLLILSPLLQSYLSFNSVLPLIIVFLGLPIFFYLSIQRGIVQGLNQFRALAKTYLVEMVLRMLVTFALVYLALRYHSMGTSVAVALGFFASFLAAFSVAYFKLGEHVDKFKYKNEVKLFLKFILLYEFSQILINNSDVLMAKHYFDPQQAGIYAALALIGRIVFFGTWTIVTLLFPKVIEKEQKGESHSMLFYGSLAITAMFGLMITGATYLFPKFILSLLFGPAYFAAIPLLWKYAFATTLFACANVFAYYYMSLDRYIPVFITIAAGLMQILGIYLYHSSMQVVVYVQIVVMFGLLATMLVYHLFFNTKSVKT